MNYPQRMLSGGRLGGVLKGFSAERILSPFKFVYL